MTLREDAPRPSVFGVPHWHGPRDLHDHDTGETYDDGHEHGADLSIPATHYEGTWEEYQETRLPIVYEHEKEFNRVSAQTGRGHGRIETKDEE